MAITKAAKKAHRQSLKRRERNLINKKKIKSLIKQVRSLVERKKIKEAKNLLPQVYQTLDKVAKTGYLKKGTADRMKSRLTKLVKKAEG